MDLVKVVGGGLVAVVLILFGMNQYQSYKINKKANDGIEAMEKIMKDNTNERKLEGKRDLVCVQMSNIKQALQMFKLDNGHYPDTEEGIQALMSNPDSEKYPNYPNSSYVERMPKDPWQNSFGYLKNENSFDLISFGADRKEGGSGESEDIFFSKCR